MNLLDRVIIICPWILWPKRRVLNFFARYVSRKTAVKLALILLFAGLMIAASLPIWILNPDAGTPLVMALMILPLCLLALFLWRF